MSVDPERIVAVTVSPEHCSECGGRLEPGYFEGQDYPWCSDCEVLFSQNPIPVVQVLVHDDESVLLLREERAPAERFEGLWNVPGGHAAPDEGPRVATLRELEEETGLRADPADLSLLTVYHAESPGRGYYIVTYTLAREDATGELTPGHEAAELEFWSVERVLSDPDLARTSDRERVAMVFDETAKTGAI